MTRDIIEELKELRIIVQTIAELTKNPALQEYYLTKAMGTIDDLIESELEYNKEISAGITNPVPLGQVWKNPPEYEEYSTQKKCLRGVNCESDTGLMKLCGGEYHPHKPIGNKVLLWKCDKCGNIKKNEDK